MKMSMRWLHSSESHISAHNYSSQLGLQGCYCDGDVVSGARNQLVAFILLFSTVRFQMSPKIACIRKCIITLIAFV